MSSYYLPGTVPSALYELTQIIFTGTLRIRYYYCPCFKRKKLRNLPKAYTTNTWQNNLAPELKNLGVVSMKTKLKALERLDEDDTHNHSTLPCM